MNPLEFIAAVAPSAGVLCVAELSSKKKQHVFADSVDGLAAAIETFNTQKQDTYFALASFVESGKRTADNALYMRAAFLDVDCGEGKPYLTKQAAAEALDLFLQESELGKLGNPWIVSSGGGLHVYWPFTEDIPIARWRNAAENLKRLCKEHNLVIDFTVTADAARVLRVPGTFNYKIPRKPRAVKIMYHGEPFDFDAFAGALKEKLNGHAVPEFSLSTIPGKRPDRKPSNATHILAVENSVTRFSKIVKSQSCGQVAYYLEHASEEGMEPLWRGMLSLAKVCVDGEAAAKKLSAMHPYDDERLQQKWREIKGPYPCTKLDGENPGICPGCKHWGKITNPLAFGREVAVDNTEREVELPATLQTTDPIKLVRPTPPYGFSYGSKGGIYRDVQQQDENKETVSRQVLVLPYDMFVIDLLNVNNEHYVYMLAMRPEGPTRITLPQKAVVSKDETVKTLAAQNIIAAYGAGNDKNLFDYVRACVENVSSSKQAIPVPPSYGWQDKGGFVAGGKIFNPDGRVQQIPMPGLENITHGTTPTGSLDEWAKFPRLFIANKKYDILALGCGIGFGSPLMELSGLDGLVFHCGSTKSGTGKTLVLDLAATIWGHPRDYRINKSTSAVALQQRSGLLRNLPLVIDEVTSKSRKDMEWFPEFVFELAEGRAKERMESGANKERTNLSVWSLLGLMSSNTHMMDYLSGGRKHSSEGEMRRMLEWTTEDVLEWGPTDVAVLKSIRSNHAVAGERYAAWLACNRQRAKDVFEVVYDRIRTDLSMTNDERYWHAGVTACVAGCILAGSKYAGVLDLPIEPIINSFKTIVEKMRRTISNNVRSADDVLNAYTRENFGRFINVRAIDGAILTSFGDSGVIDESVTRTQIMGRVERNIVPGQVCYYIEEKMLKAYCSTMSYGYADLKKELEKKYAIKYLKKDMLSKTKGPQMRVNAIMISRPETTISEDADETTSVSVE